MRRIALMSAAAGVGLIAACGKGKDTAPPPPPPPDHQVTITLRCSNKGASIDVHPWRVNVTQADGVIWFAAQDTVWITPKDPARWPFNSDRIDVPKGDHVTSTNFKPSVDPGTYKYNVNGVCDNDGSPDTVVLDPDMIIPTRIQQQ